MFNFFHMKKRTLESKRIEEKLDSIIMYLQKTHETHQGAESTLAKIKNIITNNEMDRLDFYNMIERIDTNVKILILNPPKNRTGKGKV